MNATENARLGAPAISFTEMYTIREESRLRVSENRILRRIFGPKRDENGEWRRLHNEELYS